MDNQAFVPGPSGREQKVYVYVPFFLPEIAHIHLNLHSLLAQVSSKRERSLRGAGDLGGVCLKTCFGLPQMGVQQMGA